MKLSGDAEECWDEKYEIHVWGCHGIRALQSPLLPAQLNSPYEWGSLSMWIRGIHTYTALCACIAQWQKRLAHV